MALVYTTGVLKARKHQTLGTVGVGLTAAVGLTSTNYDVTDAFPTGNTDTKWKTVHAEEVIITVETGSVRWTIDGTTPTTTATTAIGHIAQSGDVITISGAENIRNFKAINEVANNLSTLRATFLFRQ